MSEYRIICGSVENHLHRLTGVDMIFADPPDGIGLKYDHFRDSFDDYGKWMAGLLSMVVSKAPTTWISFNAKWLPEVGHYVKRLRDGLPDLTVKPCVQTYTFGQHNHRDFGNNHRPLWRLCRDGHKLRPDAVRVESWRQKNGDKRADPRGRVPGDVFEFPRVTGNSKQRRNWHPTQLSEDLVERCILMSTDEGDHVVDPFGGTGTTLRVCKRLNRSCTLIELSPDYCHRIALEHNLKVE